MSSKYVVRFICKTFFLILLIAIFSIGASGNESYEITIPDIYSDVKSCDVTLEPDTSVQNLTLKFYLFDDENLIDKKVLRIDDLRPESKNIRVISWDAKNPDRGLYKVSFQLLKDGSVIASKNHSFSYGSPTIPRIVVDDVIANSNGLSLMINPKESAIADIEYMLVNGSEVIYTAEDKRVSLHTQPLELSKTWGVILENNKNYNGRVKLNLYNPVESVSAYMTSFTAKDDAVITDVYKDEIGSSVTIAGDSQVPFEGYLKFTVTHNENRTINVVESAVKRTPILLDEEDETVEALWNSTLPEGVYKLTVELIGNDGDLVDKEESIIESDYRQSVSNEDSDEGDSDDSLPGFMFFESLLILISIAFIYRIRK